MLLSLSRAATLTPPADGIGTGTLLAQRGGKGRRSPPHPTVLALSEWIGRVPARSGHLEGGASHAVEATAHDQASHPPADQPEGRPERTSSATCVEALPVARRLGGVLCPL